MCLIFIYLLLAALSLCCRTWAFSSCRESGLVSRCGAQASCCSGLSYCRVQALGHAGFGSCGLRGLEHGLSSCMGLVALRHVRSSPQGSNPCPLHCKGDSQPLDHQRSPWGQVFLICCLYKLIVRWSSAGSLVRLVRPCIPTASRVSGPCP